MKREESTWRAHPARRRLSGHIWRWGFQGWVTEVPISNRSPNWQPSPAPYLGICPMCSDEGQHLPFCIFPAIWRGWRMRRVMRRMRRRHLAANVRQARRAGTWKDISVGALMAQGELSTLKSAGLSGEA